MGNFCSDIPNQPILPRPSIPQVPIDQFVPGSQQSHPPILQQRNDLLTQKGSYLTTKLIPILSQLQRGGTIYLDPTYLTQENIKLNIEDLGEQWSYKWKRAQNVFGERVVVVMEDKNMKVDLRVNSN